MGLITPTDGRVLVAGMDTRRTPVPALAHHVGYALQNPDHQIFAATVREELAFGPRNMGWNKKEVGNAVEEMLARFGLEKVADLPPAILGYGTRRKVATAAVAAARTAALILDEPTGGLDQGSARELLDFLDDLNRQGTTIILITHDMTIVAERARRAIALVDGHIIFDGTPRHLFVQPDVMDAAGLTPPPVTRLAALLGAPAAVAPILSIAEFQQAWADTPVSRCEFCQKERP
jgi:energy-coupling factor transport system ATP-binding protein